MILIPAAAVLLLAAALLLVRREAMWKGLGTLVDRAFVLMPTRDWASTPADAGLSYEDLVLITPAGESISSWYIPASGSGAPVLLFCHGNAGNISHRTDNALFLHRLGLSVLLFDYTGYGRSGGKPSETGVYRAARTAYDFLVREKEFPPDRIVLFGRSLGAAAAVELSVSGLGGPLILEGGFTNLYDMAGHHYGFLPRPKRLQRKYPTRERLSRVSKPVLVIHAENDRIVPPNMSRALYEAAGGPREYYLIPGAGHNNTVAAGGKTYGRTISDFIQRWTG